MSDWKEDSARKVFSYYMKRLNFLCVTSGPLAANELDNLPSRLRPVLALHKQGVDLSLAYGTHSLKRYRRYSQATRHRLEVPKSAG